ncbi:MAG: discoidin domain-containing protein, partial [Bacillota bacterium]|nr:discoidin domain-containing protein [Bacillota bacterium]
MRKKLAMVLVLTFILSLIVTVPMSIGAEGLTCYDSKNFSFITSTVGGTPTGDVTFTIPTGKTISSVTVDSKTVTQGDGTTPWISPLASAVKNYTYDSQTGAFTVSRRYIGVELDLYGRSYVDFVITFSDASQGYVRLVAVYNWQSLSSAPKAYNSSTYPTGYHDDEITATTSWGITSDSVIGSSAIGAINGNTANLAQSYYYVIGGTTQFKDLPPFYIDIDTKAETQASGLRYYPRPSNATGVYTGVTYYGSDDYSAWTAIASDTYAGDLTVKETSFGSNVSYRYYRVKVTSSIAGYAVADEIHLLKPKVSFDSLTIDTASSYSASFDFGTYGSSVVSVMNGSNIIDPSNYTFSNHVFSFTSAYVESLSEGTYNYTISLDDSYAKVSMAVSNSAAKLDAAKSAAISELNAGFYEADYPTNWSSIQSTISSYTSSINAAATISEVEGILDTAETALNASIIALEYDDIASLSGATVLLQNISTEGSSLGDATVVTYDSASGKITASGLGRAVLYNGTRHVVTVKKANIALVLISGQSNAAGDSSDYTLSVDATGDYENKFLITNSMNTSLSLDNVTIPFAKETAVNGGRTPSCISGSSWEKWSAAAASALGAKLSDEWGMKIWVVNTGVCAQIIEYFQPTVGSYTKTVAYMNAAKNALNSNGHYVLNSDKTGLFWLQGESNGIGQTHENTMAQYKQNFMNMYNGWVSDLGLNYCGIWLVRAGVNANTTNDYYMSGPRLAQLYMGNSSSDAYKNIYLILNTDLWRTDTGVTNYFSAKYPDSSAFSTFFGYTRPTTLSEIKPGLHHSQKGYNELGDEAAANIYKIMNGNTSVTSAALYDYYGNAVSTSDGITLTAESSDNGSAIAVPMVTSSDYNASANLTVTVADTNVATYDNDTFTLTAVAQGTTTASIYYGATLLATYPVVVGKAAPPTNTSILTNRSAWAISASSVQSANTASNLLDGITSTYWIAQYTPTKLLPPHYFEITLPQSATISGFAFDPYVDINGYPLTYEVYAADSDSGNYVLIYSGSFSQALVSQNVSFGFNIEVKKVKFVLTSAVSNYGAMSEFYLNDINSAAGYKYLSAMPTENLISAIGTVENTQACLDKIIAAENAYEALSTEAKAAVSNYSTLTAARSAYNTLAQNSILVDKTRWEITASSSFSPAANAIDGNNST